jgi:hypothetical protein
MTANNGRIAFYRFRPTRGTEELWLASGESLAAPAMRLPLQTVSVSSGFGIRADPFEQPRHGLGAPSRVGATLNTATARGIALGLAPGPGKTASRAAPVLMHNGSIWSRHRGRRPTEGRGRSANTGRKLDCIRHTMSRRSAPAVPPEHQHRCGGSSGTGDQPSIRGGHNPASPAQVIKDGKGSPDLPERGQAGGAHLSH